MPDVSVLSGAEMLALLPPDEREAELAAILADVTRAIRRDPARRAVAGLQPELVLLYDWDFWGRPKQHEPDGDWFGWLINAGRGYGKTRSGAEWVKKRVRDGARNIALVAETAADARDVMVEGESGILAVSAEHPAIDGVGRPIYEPSKRRLTWPNGAQATTYSGEEPGQLRGPQHDTAWVDELAKYRYPQETWDQLEFGLRLEPATPNGPLRPRVLVTTTPRPIPIIRALVADPNFVLTHGTTQENMGNLSSRFIDRVVARFEGTRLGRQELGAEILDDVPGALWRRAQFDVANFRMREGDVPELNQVVVAIDPSVTDNPESSDEVGLVVAGRGLCRCKGTPEMHGFIIRDASEVLSAAAWARRAVALFNTHAADRIVAEVNNGGDLVEVNLRTVDQRVPYRKVHASRGKAKRAEPVAALYEQGKVHHVGFFPELEDQMANTTDVEYLGPGSPDRMDAAVWALTDLLLGRGAGRAANADAYDTVHS